MEELPPERLPGLRQWYEERCSAGGARGLWWCKLCNTDATLAHTLSTEHLGKARAECVAEGLRLDAALGLPTSQWSTSASTSSAPCPAGEHAAVTFGQTAAAGPAASAAAKPNFRFKPPPPSCANYKPPPPVLTGYADQGARHVERLQQHVTQLDLRVEALEVRMGALEQQLQAHGGPNWHGTGGWWQRDGWQWWSPAGDRHQRAGAAPPCGAPGGSGQSGAPLDSMPKITTPCYINLGKIRALILILTATQAHMHLPLAS